MNASVLLADKRLQAQALRWIIFLAIFGLVVFRSLMVYLDELTAQQLVAPQLTAEKYSQLLFFFGVATVFIASGAGWALGFVFYEALRAKQFPPPGIR